MQLGLVSVMMPAYNAAHYIEEAIESVLAQSYVNWELVIVNDGSTDDTVDIVAGFADPRIRLVNQPNGGEATARNRALQELRGEFIAFLDADDCYLPEHLALTVDYLRTNPAHDGVYTDGYYCDEQGKHLQTLSSRRIGPYTGRVFEHVVRTSSLFGPPVCVVLRAAVVEQHALTFDPAITIGPDWDFFIRYSDVADFGYLPAHTCRYRLHQSNISRQINYQKRALDLAQCRSKAIQMASFPTCSAETRTAVFYDLLVKLLQGRPAHQTAVTDWPQFQVLPVSEQARLLRLMASKALVRGETDPAIQVWLRRSRRLTPLDPQGFVLYLLYLLNPRVCRQLLRLKTGNQPDPLTVSPFADMKLGRVG